MRRTLHVCGITALFALITVIHTWPLASDLTRLSRVDAPDAQLNAWVLAWVAHQLPNDPLHLFDANIFHPERYTLSYSEPLLVPALIGAPLHWLGASPVLVHNVLVMVGLVAMALGMYLLVLRFTDDRIAAILAGCLFAFNAHTLTRLPQVQAFHVEWLPLALWALDRLLTTVRYRDAWWLALFVICSALTSGYLAVFVVVMLGSAIVVRPDRWLHQRGLALGGRLIVAGLVCAVVAAALLWPYAVAHPGDPNRRTLEAVSMFNATLNDYLSTGGRFHYCLWSHRFYAPASDSLFPGVVAMGLAGVALVIRRRQRATWMLGSVAAIGCVLSFGTATPGLRVAVLGVSAGAILTGGQSIRVPLSIRGGGPGWTWAGWATVAMGWAALDDSGGRGVSSSGQPRGAPCTGRLHALLRCLAHLLRDCPGPSSRSGRRVSPFLRVPSSTSTRTMYTRRRFIGDHS